MKRLILLAWFIPALAWAADDGTLNMAGNDGTAINKHYEAVGVTGTGNSLHLTIIEALTIDEDVSLNQSYVESVACTTGDEDITAYCVKFKESSAVIEAECGTVIDQGGVEYGIDCSKLSNGVLANPRCNRCEGTE